jgi:hypothetical protein
MRTDRQTDGRTDMTKLIVTFRNYENAPKTNKNANKLEHNYSIIKNFSFLQKLLPSTPRRVHWGKYAPHTISRKRKKHGETITILPHLAWILVPKNCPTEKVFKKSNSVTKGLNEPPIHKYLKPTCSAELWAILGRTQHSTDKSNLRPYPTQYWQRAILGHTQHSTDKEQF